MEDFFMKAIKRKISAILCAALLLGTLTLNASAAFSDTVGHWAAKEIQTCADLGVVDGVGGGRFNPNGTVSNAAMTKMVIQAIFREVYDGFEDNSYLEVKNYFGGNLQWYSFYMYYALDTNLLSGVSVDIDNPAGCNAAMTRYNMAQIMYNVITKQGIHASPAQKSAAQAAIPDYADVPGQYREAVATCYALGLLTGTSGGYFSGKSTMTRAQACTVITRLMNAVNGGTTVTPEPTPSTPVMPDPAMPVVKDITVVSRAGSTHVGTSGRGPTAQPPGTISGNAWIITDNKFGDGKLNNGKEITEANVVELLMKAETIWTHGMPWTGTATPTGNNWCISAGSITTNLMSSYGLGNQGGCNGYAAMISDYIFGASSNPVRRTTYDNIRPGDIIFEMSNGEAFHVSMAVSVPGGSYNKGTMTHEGYIHCTDGNMNKKVSWPDEYTAPSSEDTDGGADHWEIYTRYPD